MSVARSRTSQPSPLEDAFQQHGQRVGLFARRASGAPDPHSFPGDAAVFGLDPPTGKDSLHQEVEMPGLAEKAGFIGGDGVDHPGAFFVLFGPGNAFVVISSEVMPSVPEAVEKGVRTKGGFGAPQPDAGFGVDQLLEFLEQRGTNRELGGCSRVCVGGSSSTSALRD